MSSPMLYVTTQFSGPAAEILWGWKAHPTCLNDASLMCCQQFLEMSIADMWELSLQLLHLALHEWVFSHWPLSISLLQAHKLVSTACSNSHRYSCKQTKLSATQCSNSGAQRKLESLMHAVLQDSDNSCNSRVAGIVLGQR